MQSNCSYHDYNNMICRLCKNDRELRNSHIIPEFFYRPVYDTKGRILSIPNGAVTSRFLQKGLREKLLCSKCEKFLNDEYELYFSRLWYKNKFLPTVSQGYLYCLEGIDYKRFKLFLLSILWRASVSSKTEFSSVALGPHEDIIRNMLLDIKPGTDKTYQIFGVLLLFPNSKNILGGIIMSPIRSRFEGRHVYVFVFGGCVWHYVVASHPIGSPVDNFSLTENGIIRFPTIDFMKFPPAGNFMKSLIHMIKKEGRKN